MGAGISVLHVCLSLDAGGLERVVLDLAREGHLLGQEVAILCIEKPGILAAEAERTGARLYTTMKGPGLHPGTVQRVRSIVRRVKPDIIHTHQVTALLYVVAAGCRPARALVHTEHNYQAKRYTTLREKWRYFSSLAFTAWRVDRFFGVSDDASNGLVRTRLCGTSRVFTVVNGIDVARFSECRNAVDIRKELGIPNDAFVLGTVGRLHETKRQDIFLTAFAKLAQEFPSLFALLIGDGPLRQDLSSQAARLGILSRVMFTGFQRNPERYLSAIDIFVQTSRIEGLPLALLEAAAAGVPVIASNVGGISEISNQDRCILLHRFGDVDYLVAKIRELIIDPDYRRAIAESGRRHIHSRYSSARMAEEYERHYAELLGIETGVAALTESSPGPNRASE